MHLLTGGEPGPQVKRLDWLLRFGMQDLRLWCRFKVVHQRDRRRTHCLLSPVLRVSRLPAKFHICFHVVVLLYQWSGLVFFAENAAAFKEAGLLFLLNYNIVAALGAFTFVARVVLIR